MPGKDPSVIPKNNFRNTRKVIVESKADEEARLKAEEEARNKAEKEAAKLREIIKTAVEKGRLKAAEEARLKAEEEEARLKAEENYIGFNKPKTINKKMDELEKFISDEDKINDIMDELEKFILDESKEKETEIKKIIQAIEKQLLEKSQSDNKEIINVINAIEENIPKKQETLEEEIKKIIQAIEKQLLEKSQSNNQEIINVINAIEANITKKQETPAEQETPEEEIKKIINEIERKILEKSQSDNEAKNKIKEIGEGRNPDINESDDLKLLLEMACLFLNKPMVEKIININNNIDIAYAKQINGAHLINNTDNKIALEIEKILGKLIAKEDELNSDQGNKLITKEDELNSDKDTPKRKTINNGNKNKAIISSENKTSVDSQANYDNIKEMGTITNGKDSKMILYNTNTDEFVYYKDENNTIETIDGDASSRYPDEGPADGVDTNKKSARGRRRGRAASAAASASAAATDENDDINVNDIFADNVDDINTEITKIINEIEKKINEKAIIKHRARNFTENLLKQSIEKSNNISTTEP